MTSREQFESWLEDVHGLYGEDIEWRPERNCYAKFGIHLAWCAWQASREAIEIEKMKALTTRDALAAGYTADYATGVEHGIQVMENAIELAGLKVKA